MTANPAAASTSPPTEFVILGSGVSTAIPRISCIIRPTEEWTCKVCHDAQNNPQSKNRRTNVAALVRHSGKTVLIDCGKTIREAAMRHFPRLGVRNVDSIVFTHGHADALLGLDDCRDIQLGAKRSIEKGVVRWGTPEPTPVYLNEDTMRVCRNVFPYLVPPSDLIKNGNSVKKDIPRRVAAIDWNVFHEKDYFKPFRPVKGVGIEFIPIPMLHGGDYVCMGFLITLEETPTTSEKVIAYLSDLHELPEPSLQFLKRQQRIDLLVVDVLTHNNLNKSHFCKDDAIELTRQLRPIKAVAVGMTCSIGFHEDVNAQLALLKDEGIDFSLAYDGQRFPC